MSEQQDAPARDRDDRDRDRDDRDRDGRDGAARGGDGDGRDEPGRYSAQHGEQPAASGGADAGQQGNQVLDPSRAEDLRGRWNEVQVRFVDEPRASVTDADQLVGEVLDEVSRVFKQQRDELEKAWSSDGDSGTEDLRQALHRYREFFDRLLSL